MCLFSYTGGRAAPQTPLLFFGTVGGREYKYIVVDIIMYTSTAIKLHFFVYWGACQPPDPLFFFRHGWRVGLRVYTCRYNYLYEYNDRCALFYTGGRAAPQTPLFFFLRRGQQTGIRVYSCIYNDLYECNDRCAFPIVIACLKMTVWRSNIHVLLQDPHLVFTGKLT